MSDRYAAPWSGMLKGISVLGSAVLLGVPLLAARAIPQLGPLLSFLILGLPAAVWLGCLLFTIRGYEIASGELLIRRLLWSTRYSLDGLRNVEHDPAALRGSLRLFGNGGLFSFSGWFRNKRLGSYRAYLTDHRRVLILSWQDRTLAISPDRPEVLAERLRRRLTGG